MKRKIISTYLILLLLSTITHTISYGMKLSITADDICKSIQNESSKWVITDMRAVKFDTEENANYARGRSWPEHDDGAEVVITFSIYSRYADLEKPMKIDYDDNDEMKILKVIKTYKYYKYKSELGIKDKVIVKEVQKQPIMTKDGLLQLK
jgi:hypothetical protein